MTRLDGYTDADARALVTRALVAEQDIAQILTRGKVLLDVEPIFGLGNKTIQPGPITSTNIPAESAYSEFNADILHAYDVLTNRGIPVELDLTMKFIGGRSNLLGYFSWGSNDERSWGSNDFYSTNAYLSLHFAPGALSDTAVSPMDLRAQRDIRMNHFCRQSLHPRLFLTATPPATRWRKVSMPLPILSAGKTWSSAIRFAAPTLKN